MSAPLTQVERECARILESVRKLELIDVYSAAKILRTTPKWVKANLPIILVSQRRQRIRLVDIEAFQAKRTVWPKNGNA